jgi:hypothetical protein
MDNKKKIKFKSRVKTPDSRKAKPKLISNSKESTTSNFRTISGNYSNFNDSKNERLNTNEMNSFRTLIAEGDKFESLFQKFKEGVFKEMKNKYKNKQNEYNIKFKTISNLENNIKNTKLNLENMNDNNYLTFQTNNKLNFENQRIKKINYYNNKEIENTKNLNEKLLNQISSFDKNTREKRLEIVEAEKDLEIAKKKCKDLSNNIGVIIVDINSGKTKLIDYHSKIEKLKNQLNKYSRRNKSVSGEINYLINKFS